MYPAQRNMIIAGVAILAVVLVVVVVVVTKEGGTEQPVKSGMFQRCDGRKDEIGAIKIDACQETKDGSQCVIKKGVDLTIDLAFSLTKDSDTAMFDMSGPKFEYIGDACETGSTVKCPIKAGAKVNLKTTIVADRFKQAEDGQVKFQIYPKTTGDKDILYCVEFPAKFVAST